MQRVSAGALRGRKLMTLPDGVPGLRPTASRVREAIFDRLGHNLEGERVLDLFAGSGALAIEALSRGAASALLFELDTRVVKHLGAQLDALGLAARAQVRRGDALGLLGAGPGGSAQFDLVFVDPPFASPHVFSPILAMLCSARWLAPDARIVCERERIRGAAPNIVIPAALVLDATRTYGQAQVEFLSLAADPEATVDAEAAEAPDPATEPDPNTP
jgi:16S rRNA (guanine966-N2)-methyltransferase